MMDIDFQEQGKQEALIWRLRCGLHDSRDKSLRGGIYNLVLRPSDDS